MIDGNRDLDVMIIGGGPGGVAALMWCSEIGLKGILFEKEDKLGGQLLRTFGPITNYIGANAANGLELRNMFLKHLGPDKELCLVSKEVISSDLRRKTITLADGSEFSARAIIIATGVRRRRLGIPGEEEFWGRGILESGARSRDTVKGETVLIVGGGDAAIENVIILHKVAKRLIVVHRRNQFSARREFITAARSFENVEFVPDTVLTSINGRDHLEKVDTLNTATSRISSIPVDSVLIRIGVIPNTEVFGGQIELDDDGYIIVDTALRTNVDNVLAIGDVAHPGAPTISTAVGHAAVAVHTINKFRN